jgi:type II secretory pathway predicted ATPase ExeA/septal ring-binding cell division protein DamX
MYLEHFGLNEPPFKITPITEFFFSGANRGEILNALIYAITDSEGIIKISGEVGSGKTMLCRMLLDRLPTNIKAIYLANPSLTRDELLYAIADGLELDLEGQRVSVLLQNLNNHLVAKYNQGERCVVLVDEAHAMPLDTLEELRLLYNLQIGKHKLIQIVLFGQPELDVKLEQNNMRQLKDRIIHHFMMQPLSKKVIEEYLLFRMRAAGYHGPDIFSPAAINLIGKASSGLMRRVNILADKSLLAAFVENTHNIETRHVQAAIRDSEMSPMSPWMDRKRIAIAGGVALSVLVLVIAGWMFGKSDTTNTPINTAVVPSHIVAANPSLAQTPDTTQASSSPVESQFAQNVPRLQLAVALQSHSSPAAVSLPTTGNVAPNSPSLVVKNNGKQSVSDANTDPQVKNLPKSDSLLKQRLSATKDMLSHIPKNSVSIQLYYTEDAKPLRIERFLSRANSLGKLSEIYIIPIKIKGKDGFRVLYGVYTNNEEARNAMKVLPQRYKDAFAPTLNSLDSY